MPASGRPRGSHGPCMDGVIIRADTTQLGLGAHMNAMMSPHRYQVDILFVPASQKEVCFSVVSVDFEQPMPRIIIAEVYLVDLTLLGFLK